MYREAPDTELDSGWRFFSGDETQVYADEAGNFELFDVNTIANYDPEIIPFLNASVGSAYGRSDKGAFELEPMTEDPDDI